MDDLEVSEYVTELGGNSSQLVKFATKMARSWEQERGEMNEVICSLHKDSENGGSQTKPTNDSGARAVYSSSLEEINEACSAPDVLNVYQRLQVLKVEL